MKITIIWSYFHLIITLNLLPAARAPWRQMCRNFSPIKPGPASQQEPVSFSVRRQNHHHHRNHYFYYFIITIIIMIIGPIKSHYALSTYLKPRLNFGNSARLRALKWPISIPPTESGQYRLRGSFRSREWVLLRRNEKSWLNILIKVINQSGGSKFSTYPILKSENLQSLMKICDAFAATFRIFDGWAPIGEPRVGRDWLIDIEPRGDSRAEPEPALSNIVFFVSKTNIFYWLAR